MAAHTFPAAIQIADARLYAGQPITEDLMMDLRDRDQDAADTGLEDRFNLWGGRAYNAGTWSGAYYGYVALGAGAASQNLIDQLFYVPAPGVSTVKIRIYAQSSQHTNNHALQIYRDGVLVAEWLGPTIPAGAGWLTWKTAIAVTPGSNHEFIVSAKTYAGGAGCNYYATGIQIITE